MKNIKQLSLEGKTNGWKANLFVTRGLKATFKGGDSMKSLLKGPIKTTVILLLPLLLSCATPGPIQQYTQGRVIDRGDYSLIGPPGDGWSVKIEGGVIEFYRPTARSGSDWISIMAIQSDMKKNEDRYPTEAEEAFEVINHIEERQKENVKKGDCVLKDIQKGITTIGEKKLHFISTKTSNWKQGTARRADVLHIFFPSDFKERHRFFTFLLVQRSNVEGSLESVDLALVTPIIDSLKMKPQIEVEPKDAKTYYEMGVNHVQKGDYSQAIYYFNKSIEMDPKNPWAYSNRGAAYAAEGQYDRAISNYTKALEIDPQNAGFYCNRAIAFCLKEQYDQAILDCNKALEIDPRNAGAYNERGIAYAKKGQHGQAISDYTKALEIDQKYAIKVYFNRGISRVDKGEYDLAISDFNKALDIKPEYAEAYYNRGRSYYFKKQYNKSWEDIKKAKDLGWKIPPEFLDDLRKASGREK
jgi:tetratricopeptide (TPR) repeat protein